MQGGSVENSNLHTNRKSQNDLTKAFYSKVYILANNHFKIKELVYH